MIGSVVSSSLRLRALVVVVAAIVMTVGIVSLRKMPVDVYPEILPVTVNVQTEALGLSAAEVEQLITVPIEADLLTGTPWVSAMRSESVPGLSSIELTFKRGTNPMHARQVVQERLTQAHALPNVSKPPRMLQPLSSTNRVMLIGLSSKTQSLIEMSVLARWTIRPRLMGVPGVANVAIWGQRERQLQVQVDPARLRDNKVSLIQIVKTTGNSLWYSPLSFLESSVAGTGGFIETPNQRIGVRHVLPIAKATDLAKVPVEGTSIPLNRVANVVEDHQPLIGDGLNGSGPGLLLVVEKLPGVNTLEVTDAVLGALGALKPGLGGIEFDPDVYLPARYIRTAIGNVAGGLLVALILVALVLLALSYDWRAALVGVLAIPISLLAAVMVIYYSGATINVMVLAGLVIALGIVVDDGVVFATNLLRRLRSGSATSMVRAILDASAESRRSIVFATVIVMLSLLPLLFMTGAAGAFVKPLVMGYGLAVLASLVVAATLTPALSLILFGKTGPMRREAPFTVWLAERASRLSPAVPRAAIVVAVLVAVVGIALVPRLRVPTAPNFMEHDLLVHWDAMPGTSRAEMNRIMERVARELRAIPGVRNVGGHVGRAVLADQVVGIHSSELWVGVDAKANYDVTVAAVQQVVDGYPGIDADVMTYLRARFGDALARTDEPIVARLYGQRLDVLHAEAEKMKSALAGIDGIVEPRLHTESTEPVVEIEVDLEAAKNNGVKPGDVRRAAATLIAGIEVGNLFEEQKMFEVVVWGEPRIRHSIEAIRNLLVDTPGGGHVRLGDVAKVQIVAAPDLIQRENVARYIDVVADVKGRPVTAVAADVSAKLRNTPFPLEYRAELLGDFATQEMARQRVMWVALAAAIGVLFVLQAVLGGWGIALAFLLSLPIALAGGVVAGAATGNALSLGSVAGLLAVLGLTVRNGILLVQRYRDLHREGLEFGPEMVQQGVRERAGSILMSALASAVALVPFVVLGAKPGQEILGPMAAVILGGLVTSTLYSLSVLPALFARFGARAVSEAVEVDDLDLDSVPGLQRV